MGARVVIGYATFHNSNIRISKSRRHYELTLEEEEETQFARWLPLEGERMSPGLCFMGDYLQ